MDIASSRLPQSRTIPVGRVVLADGIVVAASGLLFALAAGPLADWLGLPASFLRGLGVGLIPYAGVLLHAATRTRLTQKMVGVFAAVNLLWTAGSVALLVSGWSDPTTLGTVFVVLQGLIVLGFAELQWLGRRQMT